MVVLILFSQFLLFQEIAVKFGHLNLDFEGLHYMIRLTLRVADAAFFFSIIVVD